MLEVIFGRAAAVGQWPIGDPAKRRQNPSPRPAPKPRISKVANGAGWCCVGGLSAAFGATPAHAYYRWADEEASNPVL